MCINIPVQGWEINNVQHIKKKKTQQKSQAMVQTKDNT